MKDLFSFLKKVYFFQDLPDGQIRKIQRVCHQIEYAPGQIIFEEGSQADRFYIVAQGAVEVWKDYRLPEKDLLAVHERGHLFGEMALIDQDRRSATCVAATDVEALEISRDHFEKALSTDPELERKCLRAMLKLMAERLRDTDASLTFSRSLLDKMIEGD